MLDPFKDIPNPIKAQVTYINPDGKEVTETYDHVTTHQTVEVFEIHFADGTYRSIPIERLIDFVELSKGA